MAFREDEIASQNIAELQVPQHSYLVKCVNIDGQKVKPDYGFLKMYLEVEDIPPCEIWWMSGRTTFEEFANVEFMSLEELGERDPVLYQFLTVQ